VSIAVDGGISGPYATRLLDQAAIFRGTRKRLRTDNGPEFTSQPGLHGLRQHAWHPAHPHRAGSPHAEWLHRKLQWKFRDKWRNEQWFQTLSQARTTIAAWRQDYNEVRPHSSVSGWRRPSSPRCIASALAMQRDPALPPKSINLATRTSTLWVVRRKGAGHGGPEQNADA
jgi:hypothetical protein